MPTVWDTDEVSRGTMKVVIKAQGTVRSEELFRLKSTIEGRVEEIRAKPLTWMPPHAPLAKLITKEFAAMMDAKASTPGQILEERWRVVYDPRPIRCPSDCFILKVFAREQKWVQPQSLLFEAARKLRLIGRVLPGDGHWIKSGQQLMFWDEKKPKRRYKAKVEHFVMDTQGELVSPGGTFTVLLDKSKYLDPGTKWKGEITVLVKKNVLRVPTKALIRYKGQVYLPVKISTGITTRELTEIEAGARERDDILILDATKIDALEVHKPEPKAAPEVKRKRRRRRRRRPAARRRYKVVRPGGEPVAIEELSEEAEPVRLRKRQPDEIEYEPERRGDLDDEFPSDME